MRGPAKRRRKPTVAGVFPSTPPGHLDATARKERTMADTDRNDENDEQREQEDRSSPISRDTAGTLGKGAAVGAAGGAAVGAAAAAAKKARSRAEDGPDDAEHEDVDA
jgi:hypothetical protein